MFPETFAFADQRLQSIELTPTISITLVRCVCLTKRLRSYRVDPITESASFETDSRTDISILRIFQFDIPPWPICWTIVYPLVYPQHSGCQPPYASQDIADLLVIYCDIGVGEETSITMRMQSLCHSSSPYS